MVPNTPVDNKLYGEDAAPEAGGDGLASGVTAFKPMTREHVADVLGVSIRTIDNWIEVEGLPAPATIGNRTYWHPDVFYGWLHRRLRKLDPTPNPPTSPVPAKKRAPRSSEVDRLQCMKQRRVAAIEAVSKASTES